MCEKDVDSYIVALKLDSNWFAMPTIYAYIDCYTFYNVGDDRDNDDGDDYDDNYEY